VRANADTPADAEVAARFNAEGIGLCRTEHMFFEPGPPDGDARDDLCREPEDRARRWSGCCRCSAPISSSCSDHGGQPVCIRLFDPPLHEFLPTDRTGLRELADALDLPCRT
jgi:pyruvate,orthophosphate dikinase